MEEVYTITIKDIYMTLGETIRNKRKTKGYSQAQLADLLYVDRSIVSRWENNQLKPNIDQLSKLCDIFNVTLDELVEGSDNSVIENKESVNNLKEYVIFFFVQVISFGLKPWGVPLSIGAVVYGIYKKLPWYVVALGILIFLYCIYLLFFVFGIYIIPPIVRIS